MSRLAALALCVSCAIAQAAAVEQGAIVLDGVKHRYHLFAPDQAAPSRALPLVVVLHGSWGSGEEMVSLWQPLAASERFVVAGPDALRAGEWRMPQDGPAPIHALVEQVQARTDVDPRRVYLFGYSAGALFALNLGLLESEAFAAVATYAGAWQSGSEAGALEHARRRLPIALLAGDHDGLFPEPHFRLTEAALRQRGFPVTLVVFHGRGHAYGGGFAETVNLRAWQLLKDHRLEQPPVHAPDRFPDQ